MIILDSDYLSLLEWPESPIAQRILNRLKPFQGDEIATTIISFEEQIQGWIAAVNKEKEVKKQLAKYQGMRRAIEVFCSMNILDFDEIAATEFQQLRKQYPRLGTKDLKIASIALAYSATLWTRNIQDFGQISGLNAVDITRT